MKSPLLGFGYFFLDFLSYTQSLELLGRGISPSQWMNLNNIFAELYGCLNKKIDLYKFYSLLFLEFSDGEGIL
jgi:hypothetical protein